MSYQAAVITVSDRASAGVDEDKSGPAVAAMLKEAGYEVVYTSIVPDEQEKISEELISCVDEKHCDLVITSGGTGLSPRDVTPEATRAVLEREIPAIPQAMIYYSLQITPRAMLSRAVAGTRRNSLILNLPGSEKAARENLSAVLGALDHALKQPSSRMNCIKRRYCAGDSAWCPRKRTRAQSEAGRSMTSPAKRSASSSTRNSPSYCPKLPSFKCSCDTLKPTLPRKTSASACAAARRLVESSSAE